MATSLNRPRDALSGKRFLIGIGAQKAGTTWLSDYLWGHSEVFMSPIKELHYFDLKYVPGIRPIQEAYFVRRMKTMAGGIKSMDDIRTDSHAWRQLQNYVERFQMTSLDDYLDFFRTRVGDEAVCCEISPGYALLESQHYREIYTMHDDVRFLFIMRDPIERYWSNLRFYEGLLANFDAKAEFIKRLSDPLVIGRTDYDRTLTALEAEVPSAHILPLFYEELFSEASIQRLSDFAGITAHMPDFSKNVLKSREIPIDDAMKQRAYEGLADIYERMYARTKGALPQAWLDSMRRYGNRQV